MPSTTQAATDDTLAAPEAPITAMHGAAFVERARQMVAFLAASEGLDATQHFVAEELGIIVRALSGPADGARVRDRRTDDLCWRIARCITART